MLSIENSEKHSKKGSEAEEVEGFWDCWRSNAQSAETCHIVPEARLRAPTKRNFGHV